MGCDIHIHSEIKVNGVWHHYAQPDVGRNYDLFAKMAGVRNYNIQPIDQPRGLPEDATFTTKFDFERWGSDVHSASWLNSEEIVELFKWLREGDDHHVGQFGWFFGNHFDDWSKYPTDFQYLKDRGLEDFRFIFWFDN
jgi:hypothetical protein